MIRSFDFTIALVFLILLLPLFLLVAIIIKLDDAGPVFFRQVRVGKGGRPFRIWKFRTMVVQAEGLGTSITVGNDRRITRCGAWLRRWKVDELPQLINVVLGEMGFVGPRPEVPRYVALYTEGQREVLGLRPGITDLASIAYRNEGELLSRHEDPETYYIQQIMGEKIRINLAYAAKSTLWRNIKVILATLRLISTQRV